MIGFSVFYILAENNLQNILRFSNVIDSVQSKHFTGFIILYLSVILIYSLIINLINNKSLLQFRKIIIDGSNVAWNNKDGSTGGRPKVNNIEIVEKALKDNGFRTIQIIIDASLRHQVTDDAEVAQFKKKKNVYEVPAGTSADRYILELAKRNKRALIVSNDRFNEWKENDEWVNKNIENIRIPFMIVDKEVVFSKKI